mmetsp:Transcript_45414/g.78479  ORF Transcript_45414/g.78479 Transcript_45414/m.78479 type:complete len:907 (+) Transcript_45414:82-2802(+)
MNGEWTLKSSEKYIPYSTVLLLLEDDVSYTLSEQIADSSALEIVHPDNTNTHYLFIYYDDVQDAHSKMDKLSKRLFRQLNAQYPSVRDGVLRRVHLALRPLHAAGDREGTWLEQVVAQWRGPRPTLGLRRATAAGGKTKPWEYVDAAPYEGEGLPEAPGVFEAPLAYLGHGCRWDEEAMNVTGKIAVVPRSGDCSWDEQITRARGDGAVGIVIYTDFVGKTAMRETKEVAGFPVVMIDHAPGQKLMHQLLSGDAVNGTVYARTASPNLLAIDRLGRLRRFGEIYPSFQGTINQTIYFDYEYNTHKRIDSLLATHEGRGFAHPVIVPGEWDTNSRLITFPEHVPSARYNSWHVWMDRRCEHAVDTDHCKWVEEGYHLTLCPADEATGECLSDFPEVMVAKLMGAVNRESKALQDISPNLWILNEAYRLYGTLPPFKLTASMRSDIAEVTFYFSHDKAKGKSLAHSAVPLWMDEEKHGLMYDENYNSKRLPISLTLPLFTSLVKFAGYITGHGWGADDAGCAEFCPSSHLFELGGRGRHNLTFANAGRQDGCKDLIIEGTVPDQWGDWTDGHAGFCPGKGIDLVEVDYPVVHPGWPHISEGNALLAGGTYDATYWSLLRGEVYTPGHAVDHDPDPDRQNYPGSFSAHMNVEMFAVFYGEASVVETCTLSLQSKTDAFFEWKRVSGAKGYKVLAQKKQNYGGHDEAVVAESWIELGHNELSTTVKLDQFLLTTKEDSSKDHKNGRSQQYDNMFGHYYTLEVSALTDIGEGVACTSSIDYTTQMAASLALHRTAFILGPIISFLLLTLICWVVGKKQGWIKPRPVGKYYRQGPSEDEDQEENSLKLEQEDDNGIITENSIKSSSRSRKVKGDWTSKLWAKLAPGSNKAHGLNSNDTPFLEMKIMGETDGV